MPKTKTDDNPTVRVTVRRTNIRTGDDLPTQKVNVGGRMVKKAPVIEGSVNGERFAYECDRSHSMPYSHADAMRSGGWIDPRELAEVLAEARGEKLPPKKKPQASGAATAEAVAIARQRAKDAGLDADEVDAMSDEDALAVASDLGD